MKSLRMIGLGGVAFLAMTGSVFASTAQEQAQTRQLNLQQAQISNASDDIAPVIVTPRVDISAQTAVTFAPMALNSFSNPPDKVATARVVDEKGVTIGAVQKVDIDGGKPTSVEVALLGSNKIISLDARSVSYDEPNNVLMASGATLASTPRG
jgi:hypothetical protein